MFLRRYRRSKKGKTLTYFALVESVRTDAGPRQHVVAHLGELNAEQERRWQRTVVFHNRQGDAEQLRLFPDDEDLALPDDPHIVRVRVDSIGWPTAVASATSGSPAGCGTCSTWSASSIVMCRRAKKTFAPPTSSPSRSSIASASRAANSPWPSSGMPPRRWRNCSACLTRSSPRTGS